MRKGILTIFSVLVGSVCGENANAKEAKWAKLGTVSSGAPNQFVIYVDHSSKVGAGGAVKAMFLFDFMAPRQAGNGKNYSSYIQVLQFGCGNRTYRDLSTSYRANRMGAGSEVSAGAEASTANAVNSNPNSPIAVMFEAACGGANSTGPRGTGAAKVADKSAASPTPVGRTIVGNWRTANREFTLEITPQGSQYRIVSKFVGGGWAGNGTYFGKYQDDRITYSGFCKEVVYIKEQDKVYSGGGCGYEYSRVR